MLALGKDFGLTLVGLQDQCQGHTGLVLALSGTSLPSLKHDIGL